MSFAAHDDWRLPNVRELQSILDYQTTSPAVASAFNDNCSPGCPVTTCSCAVSGKLLVVDDQRLRPVECVVRRLQVRQRGCIQSEWR